VLCSLRRRLPRPTLFPYTTLFRSFGGAGPRHLSGGSPRSAQALPPAGTGGRLRSRRLRPHRQETGGADLSGGDRGLGPDASALGQPRPGKRERARDPHHAHLSLARLARPGPPPLALADRGRRGDRSGGIPRRGRRRRRGGGGSPARARALGPRPPPAPRAEWPGPFRLVTDVSARLSRGSRPGRGRGGPAGGRRAPRSPFAPAGPA